MLHLFARLMSLLVKWAKYIIEDVNVTSLHRNVTSHIETSGQPRETASYSLRGPNEVMPTLHSSF